MESGLEKQKSTIPALNHSPAGMAIQSCEGVGIAKKSVFLSVVTCLTNQTTLAVCSCVGKQKRDAGIRSAAMSLSLEQLCVCGHLVVYCFNISWACSTHTHTRTGPQLLRAGKQNTLVSVLVVSQVSS